jgi:hypothetical protein
MPTILRFRGFNIMIFVDDHEPAHVHAIGHGGFAVYELFCPDGPVGFREGIGLKRSEKRAIEEFLNDNIGILCERWREIDDQR